MSSFSNLSNYELYWELRFWEILQRVFMYLATLGPRFSLSSTYFTGFLEGVGGGGTRKKQHTPKQKNLSLKPTTLFLESLKELGMPDSLDLIRPVYTEGFLEPPDRQVQCLHGHSVTKEPRVSSVSDLSTAV